MKYVFRSRMTLGLVALAFATCTLAQPVSLNTSYSEPSFLSSLAVEQPGNYQPGSRVFFTVRGEPGARATVSVKSRTGLRSVILSETDSGLYEGHLTLRRSDTAADFSHVSFVAKLEKRGRVGQAWASESDRYGQAGGYTRGSDGREWNTGARPAAPIVSCISCGTISAVREMDEKSNEVSAPGIAIGAIAGGVLGNQIGGGNGRTAAAVLGALGGGYLGNEIGKRQNVQHIWLIDVKLDDGTTQTVRSEAMPRVGTGQRVRVEGSQLFPIEQR